MISRLASHGLTEFREVLILSFVYAIFGLVVAASSKTGVLGFVEGFFILPLVISPFIGTFGKSLVPVTCSIIGTLWGMSTASLLGMNVPGAGLAIALGVSTMINTFVTGQYTHHRRKRTVLDAVRKTFDRIPGQIYGGYLVVILSFAIAGYFGEVWLLGVSLVLLHSMVATTFVFPATINLYEHYMERRAITKFEEKVLKMINQFGTAQSNLPMIASWMGAGVEDVMHAIENLRSKHYIVSGRFFYPSNPLMWFVGVLAPLIGFSLAGGALPSAFEAVALMFCAALVIFGLSLQRSWKFKENDRTVSHTMGLSAIGVGVFFGLAISTNFALVMFLAAVLGLIVCYIPEERVHTARFGTAVFYVLGFLAGWVGNMVLGLSSVVYGLLLFVIIFADIYLAREERFVHL